MCTSTAAPISLDDPAFDIPQVQGPRLPYPKQLYLLGGDAYAKRAMRAENCGVFGHVDVCIQGHAVKCISHCNTRGCLDCAERKSLEFIKSFALTFDHTRKNAMRGHAPQRSTYLEIEMPCAKDVESIRAASKHVSNVIKSRLGHEIGYGIIFVAGFNDDDLLVIRTLALDDGKLTPIELKALFRNAKVTPHVFPTKLVENFLRPLFATCVPRSVKKRAEMDIAFKGLHVVRTYGIDPTSMFEDILVEDDPYTTKMSEADAIHEESLPDAEPPRAPHTCRICRAPLLKRSETVNMFEHGTDYRKLRYYDRAGKLVPS